MNKRRHCLLAAWLLCVVLPVRMLAAQGLSERVRLANRKFYALNNGTMPGDLVTFGRYEQDNDLTNGPEPIVWKVLDRQAAQDGARLLLISQYGLDQQPYNEDSGKTLWQGCTLRRWLNEDFAESAFSGEERALLIWHTVDNSEKQGDPRLRVSGGADTQDSVFLLSFEESRRYFARDEDRMAEPTPYAAFGGAIARQRTGTARWWLRTPGNSAGTAAAVVGPEGQLRESNKVNDLHNMVRPVLWVNVTE